MSLVKTLTARCDYPFCGAVITLNPQTSQPFRDLVRQEWINKVLHAEADLLTFCPHHASTAAALSPAAPLLWEGDQA